MTFDDLFARPIWLAPMAGGVGTVDLAVAVAAAGGTPSLAAGYLSAVAFEADIAALRERTHAPLVTNVFAPQPRPADAEQLDRYRALLEPVAERFGTTVGEPRFDDDDFAAKLDVIERARPELATFTFGMPEAAHVQRLRSAGIPVGITVTSAAEAREATRRGADILIAQSAAAGGHRSVHDPARTPGDETVADLLAASVGLGVPVVAAGGIVSEADVRAALDGGAAAVACGTAFLLADEAGTSAPHRDALRDARFDSTAVTRAFTGRPARALENAWTRIGREAPVGYPELHWLTKGIRGAARAAGDADWLNLWAGQRWRDISAAPAGEIVARLMGRQQAAQ